MDSFNKIISFILGLVVVLVFFAVVTGKINLKSKSSTSSTSITTVSPTPTPKSGGGFFGFFKSANPTPSPTQKPSLITINTGTGVNNTYKQSDQTSNYPVAKSIPATGLPTLFIPALISGLIGGKLLEKAGQKNN